VCWPPLFAWLSNGLPRTHCALSSQHGVGLALPPPYNVKKFSPGQVADVSLQSHPQPLRSFVRSASQAAVAHANLSLPAAWARTAVLEGLGVWWISRARVCFLMLFVVVRCCLFLFFGRVLVCVCGKGVSWAGWAGGTYVHVGFGLAGPRCRYAATHVCVLHAASERKGGWVGL
jgi:hypothetical protein